MGVQLSMSRRSFLAATGGLLVAFSLPYHRAQSSSELGGDLRNSPFLDSWIEINADGTARLKVGKVELGQGVLTAYGQVVADELDISMARLDIIAGDTHVCPDQGTTAGSGSMPAGWDTLRLAAAEVRRLLLERAAEHLDADVGNLAVEDGTVTAADGGTVDYWELVAGDELHLEATGNATPKTPDQYRLVGKEVNRLDLPAIMTGQSVFIQDLRPEGMVHGRMVYPPTYDATLVDVDTAVAERMSGVLAVVRNGSYLGVVAERVDQADAASEALAAAAQWDVRDSLPTQDQFHEWLKEQKTTEVVHLDKLREDDRSVSQTLQATYRRPYHMHASLGTSCAIATFNADENSLLIQTHSQSVWATAKAIAELFGMAEENVRLQHVQGAGCYGHNMADDAAADAAFLARAVPGRPVRMQYTREQEHRWEPYGSAMLIETSAGLTDDGRVVDYDFQVWSTPHGTRPGGRASNLLAGRYVEDSFEMETPSPGGPPNYNSARNAIADYDYAGHKVTDKFVPLMPLRVSSTRGLGSFANTFANESFIDELAHAAGVDPLEFRLQHMTGVRERDCLVATAERFGWHEWEPQSNRGRGIAFTRYKNYAAMSAVALEVEVNRESGSLQVLRAVASVDAGTVVNPDGLSNQIEGGFIQALSWAMKEQVTFDRTRVLADDWISYPILRFSEVPPVEVVILDRPGEPFLGSGEACCGQAAAALANAVFDAAGVRLRDVPFTPDRVMSVLQA